MVAFAREPLAELWDELAPLMEATAAEAAHWGAELDPDRALLVELDERGLLRAYTARDGARLIGYAVFVLATNPHYRSLVMASHAALFMAPEHRGHIVLRFLRWCDGQLRADGASIVTQHDPANSPRAAIWRRMGYRPLETVWARDLREGVT